MKAAILGCAHLHAQSYVDALKKLGVDVIGVTEQDMESGRHFAEANGLSFYSESARLLAEKPDFVVICSENTGHKAYALMAAAKGIHVIVEKPIATTVADGEEMIQCCRDNNVMLMVCFPVRYVPAIIQAREAIKAGKLGQVVSVIATNHGSMPGGWFVDVEKSGGGAVLDHTVHVADIMHWVLGCDVVQVNAVMDTLIHDIPTEDCGLLLLTFENGTIASIDTSWNRPAAFPIWGDVVMDFIGTEGTVRVDAFIDHLKVYGNQEMKTVYSCFGPDMDYEMMKDFLHAIETGAPAPITGEDGLFALKVAMKAYGRNT